MKDPTVKEYIAVIVVFYGLCLWIACMQAPAPNPPGDELPLSGNIRTY